MPNPFSPPSINNWDSYLAEEQCGGYWDDFTGSAYSWQSSNTAVATLPNSMLHTVAAGTETGSALNLLQATHPAPRCPQAVMQGSQPVTVLVAHQGEVSLLLHLFPSMKDRSKCQGCVRSNMSGMSPAVQRRQCGLRSASTHCRMPSSYDVFLMLPNKARNAESSKTTGVVCR